MKLDTSKFHVFTNGEDWIFGESVEEAAEAYASEVGLTVGDDICPEDFRELPDDHMLRVGNDDDDTVDENTCAEHIKATIGASEEPGWFSRLICTVNQ